MNPGRSGLFSNVTRPPGLKDSLDQDPQDVWNQLEHTAPVVVARMPVTAKAPKPPRTSTRFKVKTTMARTPKSPPSPEVMAERRRRASERAKRSHQKWLESATPEEVEAKRVAQIARAMMRQQRQKVSDPVAWAAKVREKNRQYRIRKIAAMSPEELSAFRAWERDKAKARYRAKKTVMTPEQRQAKAEARKVRKRQTNREWVKRKRAAMTDQQRAEWMKQEANKSRERYWTKKINGCSSTSSA